MKITKIETLVCHARMRNWVFVKVITDQPGLFGWGEATLEWHTRGVVGAIEDLSQLLIGQDPARVEHLWQMMWRQHFWHGSGIVRSTAIAGIDIALWDILGKVHGVPCHQLWGGKVRDYIRLYCHLGGGDMKSFYETPVDNAKRFGELALQAVSEGFSAFKSMAVPPTMPVEGLKPLKGAEACVAAMREAVGDSVDIMVDCHARPSPAMGMQFAKVLEPFGLYFLEEPCWPESIEGLAAINAAVSTPIATGERMTHLAAFRDLFAARGCEICQLDLTHWLKVPMPLSAIVNALPALSVSDAPTVPAPMAPAVTVPLPGFAAKVAPLATVMGVFPNAPLPDSASVPALTLVAPL